MAPVMDSYPTYPRTYTTSMSTSTSSPTTFTSLVLGRSANAIELLVPPAPAVQAATDLKAAALTFSPTYSSNIHRSTVPPSSLPPLPISQPVPLMLLSKLPTFAVPSVAHSFQSTTSSLWDSATISVHPFQPRSPPNFLLALPVSLILPSVLPSTQQ